MLRRRHHEPGVGVDIDEPGRNDHPAGINDVCRTGIVGERSQCDYQVILNGQVAPEGLRPGPVHDHSISDEYVAVHTIISWIPA